MPGAFANGARTRFVDREGVVAELRERALRLRQREPAIRSVRLYGSYQAGRPTPRSDADVAVVVSGVSRDERERIRDVATDVFLDAPVPVDLFVPSEQELEEGARTGRGRVAAAAAGRVLA